MNLILLILHKLQLECAFSQVRDAGNLLTRAGLTIPAVDVDDLVVRYPSAAELVGHLRVRPKPLHTRLGHMPACLPPAYLLCQLLGAGQRMNMRCASLP